MIVFARFRKHVDVKGSLHLEMKCVKHRAGSIGLVQEACHLPHHDQILFVMDTNLVY